MKKQRLQIIVLMIILLLLLATLLSVRQYNKAEEEKPEESDEVVVVDVNAEDILKFTYDYEGQTYSFEKEGDTWYSVDDRERSLKQAQIKTMLQGIAPMTAKQVIENVSNPGQYGLTEPQKTISYETASGSYIFYVGDENEVTSSYYVSMPSETVVYVTSVSGINRFNNTLEDLTDADAEEASSQEPQEVLE